MTQPARYVARFVNGVHVVLDTVTKKHVSTHGLQRYAEEAAARRNGPVVVRR